MKALYCKKCHNIIYSRANHDYRSCDCKSIAIDACGDRFIGDFDNYTVIELSDTKLLSQILYYDWNYKNNNAKDFPDGYCGKFVLTEKSNKFFYDLLIVGGTAEIDFEFKK